MLSRFATTTKPQRLFSVVKEICRRRSTHQRCHLRSCRIDTATECTTTPVCYASTAAMQNDCFRSYLSKQKKGNGGGKNKKSGGGPSPMSTQFRVFLVFRGPDLPTEVYADFEEVISADSMERFQESLTNETYLEGDETLNIYNSDLKSFEPLKSFDQIQKEQKKKKRVFIRPNVDFDVEDDDQDDDEEDSEEEEEDGEQGYDPYSDYPDPNDDPLYRTMGANCVNLVATIHETAEQLKGDGWTRSTNKRGALIKDGFLKSTRDILLENEKDNGELRSVILGQVGALDHIAECIHFDFVWDNADVDDDNKD